MAENENQNKTKRDYKVWEDATMERALEAIRSKFMKFV